MVDISIRNSYIYKVMVLNATFYNISVISWRSVLLVEETEVPLVKPTTELLEVIDKLYHVIVYRVLYTVYLVKNGIQTLSGNRLQT
jgi:hypothetical protein